MVKRFGTKSVSKRVIPKELVDSQPPLSPVKQEPVREDAPEPRVTISHPVNSVRRCGIDEFIPVYFEDLPHEISRVGVLNHMHQGGNLFHAILYSTYLPYREWDRVKKLRKTGEFRQDLARDFPVFMMRLDQRSVNWGSPRECQTELTEALYTRPEFLQYISKMINKTIYITRVKDIGLEIVKVFNQGPENNCLVLVESDTPDGRVYEPIIFNRIHSIFPKTHKLIGLLGISQGNH